MEKIDSIIITNGFPPVEGGIETYMFQLADRWNLGETFVLCDESEKENDVKGDFSIIRTTVRDLSYFKALRIIAPVLLSKTKHRFLAFLYLILLMMNRTFMKSIVPKLHPFLENLHQMSERTIIHCATLINAGSIGIFGKLLFDRKYVVYIHGSELLRYRDRLNFLLFQRFILSNADLIISNSRYTSSLIKEMGIKLSNVKVINLGADTKKFFPINSKDKIYKKYNFNKNEKLLLSISHLIPRKGIDMVIKALPMMIKRIPNIKYLVCGSGKYKVDLENLVKELGLEQYVIFAGYIEDSELNDYINACDIFIMPNRKEGFDVEGFGIVFLEANACKKPVIAGNSGGAVDAVVHEETGFLVDPMNTTEIAERSLEILSNDKLSISMAESGYNRVINSLNWGKVVINIENTTEFLYD